MSSQKAGIPKKSLGEALMTPLQYLIVDSIYAVGTKYLRQVIDTNEDHVTGKFVSLHLQFDKSVEPVCGHLASKAFHLIVHSRVCVEYENLVSVYELVPNRNLEDKLHGGLNYARTRIVEGSSSSHEWDELDLKTSQGNANGSVDVSGCGGNDTNTNGQVVDAMSRNQNLNNSNSLNCQLSIQTEFGTQLPYSQVQEQSTPEDVELAPSLTPNRKLSMNIKALSFPVQHIIKCAQHRSVEENCHEKKALNGTTIITIFYDLHEIEHEQFVRLNTDNLNEKPRLLTLKRNLHYCPTWELRFDPQIAIRAILAPTNDVVNKINDRMMQLIPSKEHVYLSSDTISPCEVTAESTCKNMCFGCEKFSTFGYNYKLPNAVVADDSIFKLPNVIVVDDNNIKLFESESEVMEMEIVEELKVERLKNLMTWNWNAVVDLSEDVLIVLDDESDVEVDDYKKSFDVKDTHGDTTDDNNPPTKQAKKDGFCLFPYGKHNSKPPNHVTHKTKQTHSDPNLRPETRISKPNQPTNNRSWCNKAKKPGQTHNPNTPHTSKDQIHNPSDA
ncbi:GDP-fucose protein O-fucosyltransferase [Artemisia annua]|uniref:GDP-fucose protein O-fucosyltransferase n=1 Tax=Artemisia annua TaxID=35608 RepID=A0A2U1PNR0_ARTAN|nr:GDP-fucose protein O-fucosyltransferase [Artemisia annua]